MNLDCFQVHFLAADLADFALFALLAGAALLVLFEFVEGLAVLAITFSFAFTVDDLAWNF